MATQNRPSVTIATLGLGRSSVDLALVVIALAATTAAVLLDGPAFVRTPLAMGLVFFVPGYVISVSLFPAGGSRLTARLGGAGQERGITLLDRVIVSVGLSLSAVVLGGLLVDALPPTLSPSVVLGTLVVLTAVALPLAVYRRRGVPHHARYAPFEPAAFGSRDRSSSRTHTLARLLLAATLLFAGVALIQAGGAAEAGTTELYFLEGPEEAPDGGESYPLNLSVDEPRTFGVGVGNLEGHTVDYTVIGEIQPAAGGEGDVRVEDGEAFHRERLTVDDGETRPLNATVSPSEPGEYRVVYLLYDGEPPAEPRVSNADEEVHLWVTVEEGATGGA